ncbi:MAG: dienelactone hydrolase family protein [Acidobacteria bacterium]|nr:MAG: dienelactone hydrolase family protein [Acidobacteriota bacterium]
MTSGPPRPPVSQELLDLYDRYAHGFISRREFARSAARFAVGGLTVAAVMESVLPRYAEAQQVQEDDERLEATRVEYPSPEGAGTMGAYLVRPRAAAGPLPGVVVIHENRGLNPHIADVTRRAALAGYVALAPDALFPLGGYPGNDDDGRALQRQRDRDEMANDFEAAIRWLQGHAWCNGRVACMGFCFGGSMANLMAVRIPDLAAAVPFYGGQPEVDRAGEIRAPLLLHFGELDERVNAGWPEYREALDAAGKDFVAHFYEGANHGFHNDTTPRYDEAAAKLAWQRTLDFLAEHLRGEE